MASTEARRGRLRVVSSLEFPSRPAVPDLSRLWRIVAHRTVIAAARELLAVGVLLGVVGLVYWPLLAGVGVYAESDTFAFFFPVFNVLHVAVRAGELPLWTPYVFGGFPLLAEGQIGAFYLPGLLAAQMPSATEGFLLLRVFHVTVATLGAFALARALRTGTIGGVVGGLTFGLGSFVVAQQHHANLLAAVVWLPLLLACVEVGLARQGWVGRRWPPTCSHSC
jgi:hypothetical protein